MPVGVRVVHKHDPALGMESNDLHWLSDDELIRYQSISSSHRKQQFLVGHYLARKMASRFYGNTIEVWIYFMDVDNQRRLKCRQAGIPEIHVSLSHSGDWVAAGISLSPIGIDIETYGKQRDFIAIASHVFSKSETDLLKSLATENVNRQFYLYWTLKECVAKQYGAGLKFEISRAHSFIPATDPAAASIFSWQCPDYVVAMAGESSGDIATSGLYEPAEKLCWQNIPA